MACQHREQDPQALGCRQSEPAELTNPLVKPATNQNAIVSIKIPVPGSGYLLFGLVYGPCHVVRSSIRRGQHSNDFIFDAIPGIRSDQLAADLVLTVKGRPMNTKLPMRMK